ncbi:MAG: hypothetical protein ACO1NW_01145 [Chitinophagaceae bacterium]
MQQIEHQVKFLVDYLIYEMGQISMPEQAAPESSEGITFIEKAIGGEEVHRSGNRGAAVNILQALFFGQDKHIHAFQK